MGLPLAFLAPWALAGLVVLPLVWLIVRITPPRPQRIPFPPFRLMRDLAPKDETPARTPPWLIALRLAIAALAVLAMAGPIWNPPPAGVGAGPLLVLMDDGWPTASSWDKRVAYAAGAMEGAARRGAPVAFAAASTPRALALSDAAAALEQLRALKPQAYLPQRAALLDQARAFLGQHKDAHVLWLADGLEANGARDFATALANAAGGLDIVTDDRAPRALAGAQNEAGALSVRVLRMGPGGAQHGVVRAYDRKGLSLADAPFDFGAANETKARIELPVELRNEVSRLDIAGERSAGAVSLIDDRWKRRTVGVVSGASADVSQPLLAPNYYVVKAIAPFADVRQPRIDAVDPIGQLLDDHVNVLVLADLGLAPGETRERLEKYLQDGGVIVRFAGTRLAASDDDLTPVRLRRGGRVLGGALSWETPKKLAPFDKASPFFGLATPDEATVSRQVLAEPEPGLPSRTWAQLADSTPLVTAERRGRGLLVLFHMTADTTWSNLPLSGLFPEMLRRIVDMAGQNVAAPDALSGAGEESRARAQTLAPQKLLDGFGALGSPSATAKPIAADYAGAGDAAHPPGYYGAPDALMAVNALAPDATLTSADFSGLKAQRLALEAAEPIDLRAPLLALAFALFVIDAFASLWLGGALPRLSRRAATSAIVIACGALLLVAPRDAHAQKAPQAAPAQTQKAQPTRRDIEAALTTRLAYVVTGDARADAASKAGLETLSRVLAQRTSLQPGAPVGVDPARDELVFYPLIYWPIVASRPQPPREAALKIAAFMKQGGTVVFDTRDAQSARANGAATPEQRWLRQLLEGVDIPGLEPVPRDHVVTKTFYLIDEFYGRTTTGRTWIEALPPETPGEANRPARAGDGVSPIIIVSNDLAAAWASDANGEPMYPLEPGGARQRELALRGGVNLVMYTLTGNYKADQVHVRDLLQRLGH
ncbi:MAG: DUF4159 domain-containing protein [Hyphomicrobiales bacterium]|nr:DUF4159 domain-containing protein [Hyphomicrobiales bacterium]